MSDQQDNIPEMQRVYAEAVDATKEASRFLSIYRNGLPVLWELENTEMKCRNSEWEARDALLAAILREAGNKSKRGEA